MSKIQSLHYYPIKSLGPIDTESLMTTEFGFAWDRYWMLVDGDHRLVSQREIPELSTYSTEMTADQLIIRHGDAQCVIDIHRSGDQDVECRLFDNKVIGTIEQKDINNWFSKRLNQDIKVIRKSKNWNRPVKRHAESFVNFVDDQQVLIISQGSINHLNEQLSSEGLSYNRFRPNIMTDHLTPHIEDSWQHIKIGNVHLQATKLCARCKITTIDQQNGTMGIEPLPTLSKYRRQDRKIVFGHYFKIVGGIGEEIRRGMEVEVLG